MRATRPFFFFPGNAPVVGSGPEVESQSVDVHIANSRKTDSSMVRDEDARASLAGQGESPLLSSLTPAQVNWMTDFACDRWALLHKLLSTWRGKMAAWESMSEEDYSVRKNRAEAPRDGSLRDIFSVSNETMGMVAGFVDFHVAQAKDDVFGTRPWLAASPEGRADSELADVIGKHANWKTAQTNIESALKDALRVSAWGGTQFVKVRWRRETDTSRRTESVARSISTGEPILREGNQWITRLEDLPDEIKADGSDLEWAELPREFTRVTFNNTDTRCVDYRDIAFDPLAGELDLSETEVFVRFRIGILDLFDAYGVPAEKRDDVKNALVGPEEEARERRGESTGGTKMPGVEEEGANPMVSLVEGFMKCDPSGSGRASRVHVIFCPVTRMLFSADYLEHVSPGAALPVFPVRCFKIPRRILGMGYFERFEAANNSVDRQHNLIINRHKYEGFVWTGIDMSVLDDDGEAGDMLMDPEKPVRLKPGSKISDLVSFASSPSNTATNTELLNQQLQMAQMRSGISSAAQGELKGVPQANTATGVREIMSRGSVLLKDPIRQQTDDILPIVQYHVFLIYANQDHDELFSWGEGRERKILEIKAEDVSGMRANVSLSLVQAQAQQKLESAKTAIEIASGYVSIPEAEKAALRPIFVQAISSLGFHNSEDIIRQPVTDAESILALVPEQDRGAVARALSLAGGQPAPPAGEPAPATTLI